MALLHRIPVFREGQRDLKRDLRDARDARDNAAGKLTPGVLSLRSLRSLVSLFKVPLSLPHPL